MPISAVTYNIFVNTVKAFIKSNCKNIIDYAGLPSCFKSGYTISYEADCADKSTCITYSAGATFTISPTSVISEVNGTQVDSDMSNFLSTYCAAINLDSPISQRNYLAFLQNMVCFSLAHCKFVSSYFDSNKYFVYINSVVYNHPHTLLSDSGYKFVQAIDVDYESKGLIDNIFANSADISRQHNIYYSVSMY